MTESIIIPGGISKKERYESLIPQIRALTEGEGDMIANIANIMSALKYGMDFFWIGVYFVKEDQLVLGPFQGPVACSRIGFGKGVCGYCWKIGKHVIVMNVADFPGHIVCNIDSRSEIVLPIFKENKVVAVLDVDGDKIANFDETDAHYLAQVAKLIESFI